MRTVVMAILGAAWAAAAPAPDSARGIIDGAVADHNPDTRKQAAAALSLAGLQEPYFASLETLFADKDVEVRLAALASLADLKQRRAIALLRTALTDPVPEVSFAAARALYALGDPAGRAALLTVVEGETKTSSGFITKQMRDTLRLMHTPRAMVLFAVAQGAGFVPVPGFGAGLSSMQSILADPGVSGRAAAVLLLAKERDRATLDALRDALGDKDGSVRAAAVHALALRNDARLLPAIEPLLDDKKEAVRLRAAAAVLRLSSLASGGRRAAAGRVTPAAPGPR